MFRSGPRKRELHARPPSHPTFAWAGFCCLDGLVDHIANLRVRAQKSGLLAKRARSATDQEMEVELLALSTVCERVLIQRVRWIGEKSLHTAFATDLRGSCVLSRL